MQIEFFKYHGTGNDFVILDNRDGRYDTLSRKQVKFLCHRRFGIGADGLMLLNKIPGYDFEMKYHNADGAEGSMCGNGGRCLVEFAHDMGIRKSAYKFKAVDGDHEAEIDGGIIKLRMQDVKEVETRFNAFVLDTGSPHYVKFMPELRHYDVVENGREIRYNKEFNEKGINVNFVENIETDEIFVRTYERGVEDETMSCGTGVTAAALVSAHNDVGFNRVEVRTPGGKLSVEFDKLGEEVFENIWLCGPAVKVFQGKMEMVDEMMKTIK